MPVPVDCQGNGIAGAGINLDLFRVRIVLVSSETASWPGEPVALHGWWTSFSSARKVLSSIAWMITRSRTAPASRRPPSGRGSRPRRFILDARHDVVRLINQIGTWRRPRVEARSGCGSPASSDPGSVCVLPGLASPLYLEEEAGGEHFTGLVQAVGRVERRGERLLVTGCAPFAPLQLGDSVAVDGVCLTVAECVGDGFLADVVKKQPAYPEGESGRGGGEPRTGLAAGGSAGWPLVVAISTGRNSDGG